ncbi:MAG: DEAD/DEAH box helicase family protein [Planctomycetes bacterium]|nr:DEAD/DEAH box helicase family protein [Planctomycetota bacterium]
MAGKIDQLIINSPFERPAGHWTYERETQQFKLKDGRRPAGYVVATEDSQSFDDPGIFRELETVNRIRERVDDWRARGWPGATGISKRLLEHWVDPGEREDHRFFFCQLEAIETLIWWVEASPAEKQGIVLDGDGGPFERLCCKMATGAGKTIVMAMTIAWQVLNKVTYPQDTRFSKNVFIVAPGLTVKNRLSVLQLSGPGNYYDEFKVVPQALRDKLRQGSVLIENWHTLNWESEEQIAKRRTVDKRGAKSDRAYVAGVLGEMAKTKNLIVLNDEAHHAWRIKQGEKLQGVSKDEIDEATKWLGGLDRIHNVCGIMRCFDFSATPFVPSGKKSSEEALFNWIVSDFSLNDAIESGLVKTPRVVIRDDALPDAQSYKSKLYHIYRHVKDALQKAEEHEPLPDLVRNAYYLLGKDWLDTKQAWEKEGHKVPPVMITVANRTETAARVKHAFDHARIDIPELCDPERALHIDSKVLDKAEAETEVVEVQTNGESDEDRDDEEAPKAKKLTKKQQAELLRQQVDTVGREGKPGEKIQNVISVGMLSEGWDAKTVTHIMGLRAFSSQLLCEQVVGRGLRRTSYDTYEDDKGRRMFPAEHVNIFGVPFTFLPHEGGEGAPPPPPTPKTRVEPLASKQGFEISWPNIIRVDTVLKPKLTLELAAVPPLEINALETRALAEMAPTVDGKPDLSKITQIQLEELAKKQRMQRIVFQTAADLFESFSANWKGSREMLLAQLIGIADQFMASKKITISPALFEQDELRRRLVLTLNMNRVFEHLRQVIQFQNVEALEPQFDPEKPIRSTGDMQAWYTGKPCWPTQHSHISHCVYDSTWEASEAFHIERSENVAAWVKNDHLGFEVQYVFEGVRHRYRPDFLIRLKNGMMLILEVKGQDTPKDRAKRAALEEWVRAVNAHGGFGRWRSAVSYNAGDVIGHLNAAGPV